MPFRSSLQALQTRLGSRVRVEVDGDLYVQMAESHLHSVLGNLIDNALSAQARGPHPDCPVHVRAHAQGSYVQLEVRDTGPGVRDENRERIFERFFTTDRESGGTGLGLPIVRAIAEHYGGQVEPRTEDGATVFRLTLPAPLQA